MGKGLRVHIETAPGNGDRSGILRGQKQIRCHQICFRYGIIASSAAGKGQTTGDFFQTTDLEDVVAVIAVRGTGAFGIGKYQMSVGLKFDLQHGKGQAFPILDDL